MDLSPRTPTSTGFETRRLRLATLTNTRWLAVAGQAIAIAFVAGYLQFELPLLSCLLLVGLSAALNLVLTWCYPPNQRFESSGVAAVLAFDIVQLSALLFLTGGLENPFSILLAVPVLISAASLPLRFTAYLGIVAVIAASILAFRHLPLPWVPDRPIYIPPIFVAGIWTAVVSSLAFTAFYIHRVADEARRLADALAATELVLAREQHLSALDGLAAAAAHELGTPLATISLVAKEMDRAVDAPEVIKEDISLLRAQADRCREILGRISTLETTSEEQISRLPFLSLIEEVIAPHREFGVQIDVVTQRNGGPEPVNQRNSGVLYGLGNIVENAVDFADKRIQLNVIWDEATVEVQVLDDGPGFPVEQIERLGEPDLGRRNSVDRNRKGGSGLGLGIFIAKTLLERSGASISFAKVGLEGHGARVTVIWPRAAIDDSPPHTN